MVACGILHHQVDRIRSRHIHAEFKDVSLIYLSGYLPILIDLESEVIFSEASAELDNHLRLPPSSSSRVCT